MEWINPWIGLDWVWNPFSKNVLLSFQILNISFLYFYPIYLNLISDQNAMLITCLRGWVVGLFMTWITECFVINCGLIIWLIKYSFNLVSWNRRFVTGRVEMDWIGSASCWILLDWVLKIGPTDSFGGLAPGGGAKTGHRRTKERDLFARKNDEWRYAKPKCNRTHTRRLTTVVD